MANPRPTDEQQARLEREELRRLRERIATHPGSADDGWSALAVFDRLTVRLATLQAELHQAEQRERAMLELLEAEGYDRDSILAAFLSRSAR